jgi:hypothetical protein
VADDAELVAVRVPDVRGAMIGVVVRPHDRDPA